jgi:hypothetical protein
MLRLRNVLSLALRLALVAGPSALLGAGDYYHLPNIKWLTRISTALRGLPL